MKTKAIIKIVLWSIVAMLLTSVLLGVLFIPTIFNNFNINLPFGFSYKNSGEYIVGNTEVYASEITNIEINWISGNIDFQGGDTDKIIISENYNGEDNNKLHYLVKDGKLTIQYCQSRNVFKWFNIPSKKNLTVTLPSDFDYSKIEFSVVSAELNIKNVNASEFKIDGVSGDINLNNINTNELSVDAVSADITGENLTVTKEIDIDCVSGKCSFSGSIASFKGDTASGNIKIISSICPEKIKIDTVSGDVEISIPENDGFTIEYDTVSGELSNDFPVTKSHSKNIYKDGSAKFQFDSASGDVRIILNNEIVPGASSQE